MLAFLIYIFLKKYCKLSLAEKGSLLLKILGDRFHIILMGLLIMLLLLPGLSRSQYLLLNYKIIQGGDNIGWLRLEKNIKGAKTDLLLVSEIKTRFIFQIKVSAKERSLFENGQLLFSSQYRKSNGTVKLNKQTCRVEGKYVVNNNGEKQPIEIRVIATNLLSLYFQEPLIINTVYCDKLECFVKIVKTDDGGYKVEFPDGNSNTFYYSNGICSKIRISHTFYTAEIILTS